ncbi:unnamed protein product [Gongylonema pulchrum]|uniref:Uncharacterized protein n=1 Tax=Gongylonema pulchrum TaxID=637853 RepID=A0A3P7MKQ7_9BILA|nr:unnamed protein product [Gongylonema pulchrum]
MSVDEPTIAGDKSEQKSSEAPTHEFRTTEEDTLPPEVKAADPFATTSTEESIGTEQQASSPRSTTENPAADDRGTGPRPYPTRLEDDRSSSATGSEPTSTVSDDLKTTDSTSFTGNNGTNITTSSTPSSLPSEHTTEASTNAPAVSSVSEEAASNTSSEIHKKPVIVEAEKSSQTAAAESPVAYFSNIKFHFFPQVKAADPFATTSTEESIGTEQQVSSPKSTTENPAADDRGSGPRPYPTRLEDDRSSRATGSEPASTVSDDLKTTDSTSFTINNGTNTTTSSTPSSLPSEHTTEASTNAPTVSSVSEEAASNTSTEIHKKPVIVEAETSRQTAAAESPERAQSKVWETLSSAITETTPDVFDTSDVPSSTSNEKNSEIPLLSPVASHTFSAREEVQQTQSTRTPLNIRPLNKTAIGEITPIDTLSSLSEPSTLSAESESSASAVELVPSIAVSESVTKAPLSEPVDEAVTSAPTSEVQKSTSSGDENAPTVAGGSGDVQSQEQDHGHEHEHDDESLFVGDKTLFSQDNTMKALQDFSTTRPVPELLTPPEVSICLQLVAFFKFHEWQYLNCHEEAFIENNTFNYLESPKVIFLFH